MDLSLARLVPPVLAHADFETRRRARLLVFAVVLANVASLIIGASLIASGASVPGWMVLSTLLLHTAIYGLLFTGSTRVAAHLFVLLLFFEMAWDYGRDDPYSVLSTLLLPLVSAALVSARAGVVWTAIGIAWAGWVGPMLVYPDIFSLPLSYSTAAITFFVGCACVAIETNRAETAREAADANQALRARDDALSDFIDSTFPAHIQTDALRVVEASAEAGELVGMSVEALCQLSIPDLLHPDEVEMIEAQFAASGDKGFKGQLRLRRADGSYVWVEAFGVSLLSKVVSVWQAPWVFAARDVDEERRREENWQRAQRLEGVGLLAAGVAHDFNNLLTVIRGETELMPESAARQSVLDAADRAAGLTASLMRFGRVAPQGGGSVDVAEALDRWAPMFQSLLGEACELRIRRPSEPLPAALSESQLNQVLLNLVTNAKEAMRGGGQLALSLSRRVLSTHDGAVHDLDAGEYVLLRVRDSGVGMPREVRDKAFDPFFTTKEMGQGSGLGLASVYGIVQQQAGSIEIDSAPGQGTLVSVWLPLAPLAVGAAAAEPKRSVAENGRAKSVLLVEDNDDIRTWAERALRAHGFSVVSRANGDAAAELLATTEPDLLITDIVMGGMRGTELARLAREHHPHLSILFISGYADRLINDWRQAAVGNARFLAKPFGVEELVREAEALIASAVPEQA